MNNTKQVDSPLVEGDYVEKRLDNGEEGNFWSDYTGVDKNMDGIGDSYYVVNVLTLDEYPLMSPWTEPQPPNMWYTVMAVMLITVALIVLIIIARSIDRSEEYINKILVRCEQATFNTTADGCRVV